jgi:hypothetical protein
MNFSLIAWWLAPVLGFLSALLSVFVADRDFSLARLDPQPNRGVAPLRQACRVEVGDRLQRLQSGRRHDYRSHRTEATSGRLTGCLLLGWGLC